jgi:hypothetical protein
MNAMKSNIIKAFAILGKQLSEASTNEILIKASELSTKENTWFNKQSIDYALKAVSSWLKEDVLIEFTDKYEFNNNPKRVAVICAGNIPMVGFHDMMCVVLSGNIFYGKLSHSDKYLLPAIADILIQIEPLIKDRIIFEEDTLKDFDAVIATGSNNTSRYFDYYFKKYPNIIRHSRSSIAVLDNSSIDYSLLISDILTHKGLGCRNVTKIYIPNDFDFSPLIKASQEYSYLLDHNKYRNNYDYHKAIFIINNISFIDTGVLLLLEAKELFSAVSVLNYEFYDNIQTLTDKIELEKENIQCVVSNISSIEKAIPIGKAQEPSIDDFADNIDTMLFLESL